MQFLHINFFQRYERWRRGDNQMMIDAMAFFKQGLTTENSVLKQLRNLSLKITQRSQWLRKVFMHHAMGLRGELLKSVKY